MRLKNPTIIVLATLAVFAAVLLVTVATRPKPGPLTRTGPAKFNAAASTTAEPSASVEGSAPTAATPEASLPEGPTPGRMTVVFALPEGGKIADGTTMAASIGKPGEFPLITSSRPVFGRGPWTIELSFDPKALKPGRGYALTVKVGKYIAENPFDDEVPSGIELMGQ